MYQTKSGQLTNLIRRLEVIRRCASDSLRNQQLEPIRKADTAIYILISRLKADRDVHIIFCGSCGHRVTEHSEKGCKRFYSAHRHCECRRKFDNLIHADAKKTLNSSSEFENHTWSRVHWR